jgi:hypothetical protein
MENLSTVAPDLVATRSSDDRRPTIDACVMVATSGHDQIGAGHDG